MQPITVVIADADRARRIECERLLRQGPDLRLVAQAAHFEDLLPIVTRYRPRLLVLGLSLRSAGCDPLSALHRQCPETSVILLQAYASQEDEVLRALTNGARGYLTHETVRQQLCKALHGINDGDAWVSRKMLGSMFDRVFAPGPVEPYANGMSRQ